MALRTDLIQHRQQFTGAAVGRAQRHVQLAIRSDETLWLRGTTAAQRAFCESMEIVRLALNRHLYLGLFDCEAHYACYAPGAFYRRHIDTFNDGVEQGPRRVISMVFYLNTDWRADDGGELLLWNRHDEEIARIIPNAGTAVFFLSDGLPHEVLPAAMERYSIAGWFRTRGGQ
jgi:SM-20-related protein